MIKKASFEDIDNIIKITQACARQMEQQDIYQWNNQYPSRAAFENDFNNDELYVIERHKSIVGCMAVTPKMSSYYSTVEWLGTNNKAIYVHRLAIDPNFQGKGFAQELMSFAESYAKNNKYHSVRLDTFSKNTRNQKFYELRGYKRLGEIFFPKQSEFPFYCYQLLL